ncbi:MAG: acylneuraminate cytidylyltransferase family protein [Alphaproteobacteria bacterium]|uniref:Acylneuraminate cytidylyltransferase family protein n=1 Tax=Candidatus Nitrobium versatile TaxID=2884831 RepID=A0A953JCN7_9BACT|nr:acylneuraminate cytidylyltransferase family protein [Candidatus Nitrobium versatile]
MNILCVIPARAGSKGVKNKNLREVAGRPLISYIIESAKRAETLGRVIVSTESEAIAEAARKWGAETPFMRPFELARDHISLIPVAQHALHSMDALGWRADAVVSLQPTSPLTSPEDIDRAVGLFRESGCDSVVSVERIEKHHPFRAYAIERDTLLPFTEYTSEKYLQRQDRPPAYGFTGALYVRKRELLENWSGKDFCLGQDVRGVVIDRSRSLNIDAEDDLEYFAFRMSRAKT